MFKRYRTALVCLALLIAGLALRLPGLGSFLTPDEEVWSAGSAQFLTALAHGDWSATRDQRPPGRDDDLGRNDRPPAALVLCPPGRHSRPGPTGPGAGRRADQPGFPALAAFPVALVCVLGSILIYLLARRLLGEAPALLGAGLLAFDPFYLAHSRVLQMDALLATFVTLAWLALLLAAPEGRRRYYYILSGLSLALAILTKSPGLVIGPLMAGWLAWRAWCDAEPARSLPANPQRAGVPTIKLHAGLPLGAAGLDRGSTRLQTAARLSLQGLLWLGLPALLAIGLLWPALWAAPLATTARVWNLMTTYSQTGHELGNFWLGRPVSDPGPLFLPRRLALAQQPSHADRPAAGADPAWAQCAPRCARGTGWAGAAGALVRADHQRRRQEI